MKISRFIVAVVLALLGCEAFTQTQSIDKEISALAEKLAAQVKESGRKKVAVLEFTDLQGNTSELGRFLAEEVSVSLVERRAGFSVIDRANLTALLSEKNLTEKGLVDPKNAEEFNKASGVEAIILGKFTALKGEITLAAKIIATDSAETVGAARARLPMSKELEQLISSGAKPSAISVQSPTATAPVPDPVKDRIPEDTKEIAGLRVRVESIRLASQTELLATFLFQNTTSKGIGCAFPAAIDGYGTIFIAARIVDHSGNEFRLIPEDVAGISWIRNDRMESWRRDKTTIGPGETINVSAKFQYSWSNGTGRLPQGFNPGPPFRVQFEQWTVLEKDGEFPQSGMQRRNFVFEFGSSGSRKR